MTTVFQIDDLPPELFEEILSRLTWRQQLAVRSVSRRWQEAADACLARRRELDLTIEAPHPETLLSLLESMPALRRLSLGGSGVLIWDSASVERLCTSCPQLQVISMTGLKEGGVETLLRGLPGLRSLKMIDSRIVGDCLSFLPVGLESLSLTKGRCGLIDGSSLRHLTLCPQLRCLSLGGIQVLSEQLRALVAAYPQLEKLSVMSAPQLKMDWLSELKACTNLRELTLSAGFLPGEQLSIPVAVRPQLEKLSVTFCSHLAMDWLPELGHCPRLRQLVLSGSDLRSEQMVSVLASCSQLERLDVAFCYRLTADWLPELKHCRQLQELDISALRQTFGELTDPDLSSVSATCGQLKKLRIRGMLNPLSTFLTTSPGGLTHLDLSFTATDDATFCRIPDLLPGLCDLRLRTCKALSDSTVASVLPRLANLQVLDMRRLSESQSQIAQMMTSEPSLGRFFSDGRGYQAVLDVMRRCPKLAVICADWWSELIRSIVTDLARDPLPADRKVAWIVEEGPSESMTSLLPINIRVVPPTAWEWVGTYPPCTYA